MSKEDEMLEELKKISNALTPPPPPPSPVIKKGLINEFKTFLSQYKVMGLAVAFILGIYLGELIKSLVDNLIMPIVEFFYTRIRMAKYNDRSFWNRSLYRYSNYLLNSGFCYFPVSQSA